MTNQLSEQKKRAIEIFKMRGFAFVHVPKTAGYSITRELLDGNITEHATATELRNMIGKEEWSKLFAFAFVRDPATRFISAFWYLKAGGMNQRDSKWANTNLSGVQSAEKFINILSENNTSLGEWVHFKPQYQFVSDSMTGAFLVNYIGRYENLKEDYRKILSNIAREAQPLSRHNQANYSEKIRNWKMKSRHQLFEMYQRDYEIFGYPHP
ncbi:MAG: sulfotransferase family 2 domain-containing protein [Chitinophagaceae bacterium]